VSAFHPHAQRTLSVAAMRVCNPGRSPVGINRCDAAPTPTGFAQIVSDDFSVFDAQPHRDNEKGHIVAAEEKLTAFLELEWTIRG
jgi:hypothetical protein